MNVIDKMVAVINPVRALEREKARCRLGIIQKFYNSGYDEGGASHDKNSMRGWRASSKSPQEDIDRNLDTLRQRSRSLMMSAPIAVSAIKTNRTNIVGMGLRLRPTIDREVLGMSDEEAKRWEKKTQREFELWAKSKQCDATKVNNFYEMQQIVCMSWLTNGDAVGLIEYCDEERAFMPYELRIHLIESDKVCNPQSTGAYVNLWETNPDNGNRIYNGVEIDSKGGVVAYHICNTYPNSALVTQKKWTRVKAFGDRTGMPNVLMIFESERAEQYRGVPYLAPVIEALKQLTRYSEAEIMAAVINGFFTVFITSEKSPSEMPFTGIAGDDEDEYDTDNSYGLGPGMINVLAPGEDIKMADPSHPNSNFDAFTTAYAKYIGAALEIPSELLLKQFGASYSASKAALEEAWKAFKMRRAWLIDDFCKPIYEIWLTEAIAKGRIKAPGFYLDASIREAWCKCAWNGPAQGMLDPLKEIKAAKGRVDLGVSTREIETMEMNGGNFDDNAAQLKHEAVHMGEINSLLNNTDDAQSNNEEDENGENQY
jgi:phage portal protein, lambda family|nr:MAG TPA: portal protein [Caudoviricetes sp.]DAW23453.1 MAG TPA: portal protein [Caudoviricetes sp.]